MQTISTIYNGDKWELRQVDGEGFCVYLNGVDTKHRITAPDKDIALGYFEDYVQAVS